MPNRHKGQPFTCSNARYHTDDTQGHPHGDGNARGSVLDGPVCDDKANGVSLWLEYVKDGHGVGGWNPDPLWLMWYDMDGNPTISQSATFDLSHLREMIGRFIR